MKTLVVLAALAAVTLSAPTLLEQGSEDFKKFENIPEIFKRERKSTQESSNADPATGEPANLPSTSHITEFGVTGRSFGLKKPIIIKKKPVGYQVYRDSDEVPAESGETCESQVKVKFCDGKTKLKSSTTDDNNAQMTEEDMKHSITLAKEAIENLQKDLNTVERKPGTQASSWSHGHSESDAELHQDIENAREALEHIHKNFGNFESMSLHTATIKDDTAVPEALLPIAKTEEQRLAQWKEAIDTIQKNVEIAKNIEDSFRLAPDAESGSLVANDMMVEINKQELDKKIDHNLRTSDDKHENRLDNESCKVAHAHEKSNNSDKIKDGSMEDDMASAASTISEKKTPQLLIDTTTYQPPITTKPLEGVLKVKESIAFKDPAKESLVLDSMKSAEENEKEKNKKIVLVESLDNINAPINTMKSVEAEDMLKENQNKAAVSTKTLEKLESKENQEKKSAELLDKQSNNKNKKEDKVPSDLQKEQAKQIDTALFVRNVEEGPSQEQTLVNTKLQKSMTNEPEKQLVEAKLANNVDLKTKQAIHASVNDIEHKEMQEQNPLFQHEMRSEDLKNMHQQQMMNPRSGWGEEKNMQLQREAKTAPTGLHPHMVQHPGHNHRIGHGMQNQHFEMPNNGLQSRFMTHEKSADQDMQAYYMNMRDGSGLAPENSRFLWKPTHESSRSAYGAPAAPVVSPPSGNAVGVFPNAHIGGCGIPLLLSCNPSVVSGSLAKPSPAPYSAPSYRTDDDFTFHTKRDVKKTYENQSSSLNRSPKANMKTSSVLVAKQ